MAEHIAFVSDDLFCLDENASTVKPVPVGISMSQGWEDYSAIRWELQSSNWNRVPVQYTIRWNWCSKISDLSCLATVRHDHAVRKCIFKRMVFFLKVQPNLQTSSGARPQCRTGMAQLRSCWNHASCALPQVQLEDLTLASSALPRDNPWFFSDRVQWPSPKDTAVMSK